MCLSRRPYTEEEARRTGDIASFLASFLTLLLGAVLGYLAAYIHFRL